MRHQEGCVCVFELVCECIWVGMYVCVFVWVHVSMYLPVYVSMYVCKYMLVCIYVWVCAYVPVCAWICVYMCMCERVCVCVSMVVGIGLRGRKQVFGLIPWIPSSEDGGHWTVSSPPSLQQLVWGKLIIFRHKQILGMERQEYIADLLYKLAGFKIALKSKKLASNWEAQI